MKQIIPNELDKALRVFAQNEEAFPYSTFDIIREFYGSKLDTIKPVTLMRKLYHAGLICGIEFEENDMIEVINDFIHS
jgi:hypothetical protein